MKTTWQMTCGEYVAINRHPLISSDSESIDDHYEAIAEYVKAGGKITQEVFDSLEAGKKLHFQKHYNSRGGAIINEVQQ